VAGVAALAIVLFIVLRPDDEDDSPDTTAAVQTTPETTTTDEATTEEATTEESTTEEAPTTTEAGAPQRVVVVVRNGQPVGGVKHAEIEQGEQVLFIVRSDVSDHVHLHGYDLLADVAPGQPARIRFRATESGVFEAELEDRVVIIAELEVRP
jgi:hypothetical protein